MPNDTLTEMRLTILATIYALTALDNALVLSLNHKTRPAIDGPMIDDGVRNARNEALAGIRLIESQLEDLPELAEPEDWNDD